MTRLLEDKPAIVYGAGGTRAKPEVVAEMIARGAMLKRAPRIQQVADVAAFLASDRSSAMTASIVNVTCGLVG
jgi:enoyl-[acyl-carrier-protein] reductase (NADH)